MRFARGENEGVHILKEVVCRAIPNTALWEANGSNRDTSRQKGKELGIALFRDDSPGDSHKAFQKWRKTHPHGFFLNCRSSSSALLHRVDCQHPGNTEWSAGPWGSLTSRAKICSENVDALREWANEHGYDVSECQDCRP
jgi:hypothetical protein